MGNLKPFPLPISYGATDVVRNSGGFLVNLEAEAAPQDARTPVSIVGSPGLSLFTDTGDFPCVAMLEVKGACYLITRNAIYRVFPDKGTFKLGNVAMQLLSRAETNGLDIVVTDGFRAFKYTIRSDEQSRYDTSAPFVDFAVEITSAPNFYPSSSVAFLDQYLIFGRDGTNQFFNTGLLDVTFDALAFGSAETNPDNIVATFVNDQTLWALGTKSAEPFYDDGVPPSPFSRVPGAVAAHGLASPWCVATVNSNMFTVTPEGTAFAWQGYQPRPISTTAIEDEIKTLDLTTAQGFCYTDGGHFYYQLTVEDLTFAYDMSTQLWHRRRSHGGGRHIANCHAFAFGLNLVGSYADGKVYHMSRLYSDEDGDPLISEITTGPIPSGGRQLGITQIMLEIDVGLGNVAVENPQIGLRISRDDGKVFGNERLTSLGAIGDYKRQVRWHKNGSAISPRFRFTISDPIRRGLASQMWMETD